MAHPDTNVVWLATFKSPSEWVFSWKVRRTFQEGICVDHPETKVESPYLGKR